MGGFLERISFYWSFERPRFSIRRRLRILKSGWCVQNVSFYMMVYLKPFSDVAIPLSTPMDPEPEGHVPGWSCANARDVTRPVDYRRYLLTDFTEPDRYMEAYRP